MLTGRFVIAVRDIILEVSECTLLNALNALNNAKCGSPFATPWSARKRLKRGIGLSKLQELKDAKTIHDLAKLLGFEASALAYILYKIPDAQKYESFELPKKNGGTRNIQAPDVRLKTLQQHLSNVLHACKEEIEADQIKALGDFNYEETKRIKQKRTLAHGFVRDRSIHTNAICHRNRRFVLNFDLEDFFPSINFGRVMGFFMKNKHFELERPIAVMIAQIACHDKVLPQGSPCSPIVSNLIAHLLDIRLVQIARKYKCKYSRYADDITFSTNQKIFPPEIATREGVDVQLGKKIIDQVTRSGFKIHPTKSRLCYRDTRQTVTGLVVNEKVNVRPEYYRYARAMAHGYFHDRKYVVPSLLSPTDRPDTPPGETVETEPHRLEGILQHIHYTRDLYDHCTRRDKQDNPTATWKLFNKFLYFRHFGIIKKPLIICEGVSDPIYLKLAIKKLALSYPDLIGKQNGQTEFYIGFLKYSRNVRDVLRLSGGTGELNVFVGNFKGRIEEYKAWSQEQPIILLTDNDDGAKKVFGAVKGNSASSPTINDNSDFYPVNNNLYLVKTPHITGKKDTAIEDLFDPYQAWEKKLIGARKFTRKNDFDEDKFYGKREFAEQIIAKNFAQVNFDGFKPLLDRIVSVINHHKSI